MTDSLPLDADIWVLAGQSNMAGPGTEDPYEEPSDRVWVYSLRDEWEVAREPFVIDRYEAVDEAFSVMRGEFKAHLADPEYRRRRATAYPAELRNQNHCAGLGLPFAKMI